MRKLLRRRRNLRRDGIEHIAEDTGLALRNPEGSGSSSIGDIQHSTLNAQYSIE
jgi:hypothetical protein